MLDFTILDNGKLKITLADEDHVEFIENIEEYGLDNAFYEACEPYWANGWGVYLRETFACYTGIIICDDASIDDDGQPELYGDLWKLDDNCVTTPSQELLENGFVIFYRI